MSRNRPPFLRTVRQIVRLEALCVGMWVTVSVKVNHLTIVGRSSKCYLLLKSSLRDLNHFRYNVL